MARKKEEQFNVTYEGCFGEQCKASQIVDFLVRLCEKNFVRPLTERWSANIWGHAGVGKTSLVKDMEKMPVMFQPSYEKKPIEFSGYKIVDIPLAQIEEMGDILGVPDDWVLIQKDSKRLWVLAKDSVISQFIKNGWDFVLENGRMVVETRTAPPEWVPKEERPGVILFDDANRASIRILKGIMQLVQNYRTIGWSIPAGWTICFTGNPDRQNYLVQTVDQAIITRQRHITMKPDAKEWAIWAENKKIDKRGINFILRYPEMMIGRTRTNLRTLTEFFVCLEKYPDVETSKELVHIDGMSLIDKETLEEFFVFASRDMKLVIEPEQVLEDVDKILPEIDKLMVGGKEPRVDILGITCDRIYAHILQDSYEVKEKHVTNFQKFISYEHVPEDLRHSLMKRIAEVKKTQFKKFLLGDSRLLKYVAKSLRINL